MNGPVAFVAGWPVEHSRSPLIHRLWLRRFGLAGDYLRKPVRPEDFATFLSTLAEQGLVGGNVTLPHKKAAFRACRELTDTAARLGAVNTVWLDGDRLAGDNTDVHGFASNLDQWAPDWRNGRRAVVLGAGGASRAVIDAVLGAGFAEVAVLNRTTERAVELARLFGARLRPGGLGDFAAAAAASDLIVNTTSAGLGGREALALDWRSARPEAIATDIVYSPLVTPFLRGAAERGLRTVDGLGMLLHQAVPGFERWFGRRPVVDAELRDLVLADLGVVTP